MKIIFLDHDGVICLSDQFGTREKKGTKYLKKNPDLTFNNLPFNCRVDNFDKKAVKVLNSILEETEAEIVVSSDWKLHGSLEEIQDFYTEQGIIKKPIGFTTDLWRKGEQSTFSGESLEENRIREINNWLNEHQGITHWVAIDDLDMGEKFGEITGNSNGGLRNFVLTPKEREGIKQSGKKEKILSFLL